MSRSHRWSLQPSQLRAGVLPLLLMILTMVASAAGSSPLPADSNFIMHSGIESLEKSPKVRLSIIEENRSQYEVHIPSHDQKSVGFFSAKNIAIILVSIAMLYLCLILIQVCRKKPHRDDELEEEFISQNSLSYEYTYDEEYTNSQYLRSDDQNSLVDHKHFRYD